MTVDILISTISSNVKNIPMILLNQRADVFYIVSIQKLNDTSYDIPSILKEREDVKLVFCEKGGLSLNRNNCLKNAKSDICVIADDDVRYKDSYIDELKDKFIKDTTLDILSGKIKTNPGEQEYKEYKKESKKITFFNFKNISSVEIAFRRKSIIDNNLTFDQNFGLGSPKYSTGGEESIFIRDAIFKKLKIVYFPFYLVNHPYESSGKINKFDQKLMTFLGGYSRRLFGLIGFIFFFYFLIRHRSKIKSVKHSIYFFVCFFKGFFDIK
ncbi:glycosyltransferase family 2 protein [Tenacibaculum dicentrarchi]|nr:glycosyltransferase family 2 protein [Tenacibaculum dicentrarchi]MCD8408192.1 glycosyltransferase family 2 protein [Tenacibaculum dicentrarchi]MCD8435717.1 glycosyltransferase family 2 protein [Tenacibaculum dicentrarchi]MCD8442840.1 glycosyltransferase family 2 protein [Tenacibaculum dicentrarchi]MCD8450258.1 glycosyltransferase family 2 protein [Tenacibaculum dicentrarchi]